MHPRVEESIRNHLEYVKKRPVNVKFRVNNQVTADAIAYAYEAKNREIAHLEQLLSGEIKL